MMSNLCECDLTKGFKIKDGVCQNCGKRWQVSTPAHKPNGILKHFAYYHLPAELLEVSKSFSDLATHLSDTIPAGPELSVALRKLLEAKDAAVRAKKFPGG